MEGIMKKSFLLIAGIVLVLAFMPAYALGAKPDNPGQGNGGGNGDDDGGTTEPAAKSVCIDPGHGGDNIGTSNGDFLEKDLNLDVAKSLATKLESNDYETHLTREGDETKSNRDRYEFCNSTDASLLVSIHHNGSTDSSVDYTLGLYHQKNSQELTETVGLSVAEEFNPDETFRTDKFPSGVLIKSDMPSMMSEGYFLTNDDRLEQLQNGYDNMVDREAEALSRGISSYIN